MRDGHPRSRQATNRVADPVETTATVLAEIDKSENLTERELMVTYVFRNLVSRFREMEKKPINYFKFVLDPVCFGTSIENMFCVSFLMEEGKMDISVCEEIGLALGKIKGDMRRRGEEVNWGFLLCYCTLLKWPGENF